MRFAALCEGFAYGGLIESGCASKAQVVESDFVVYGETHRLMTTWSGPVPSHGT